MKRVMMTSPKPVLYVSMRVNQKMPPCEVGRDGVSTCGQGHRPCQGTCWPLTSCHGTRAEAQGERRPIPDPHPGVTRGGGCCRMGVPGLNKPG